MGATIVLQNHGAVVYIDEIDPEMPPYSGLATSRQKGSPSRAPGRRSKKRPMRL